MQVAELQRDALSLHDGQTTHHAPRTTRALPQLLGLLTARCKAVAVGDWVLAECSVHGEWWVHTRVTPLNQLTLRVYEGRGKILGTVIVSTVDEALLLMRLDADFSLRRLERYLALVRSCGVQPVVVLSKADPCQDLPWRLHTMGCRLSPETPTAAPDARSTDCRERLAHWLGAGRTAVLLGSSGAGKSRLINSLMARDVQRTCAMRHGDGRGRHTTTTRSVHRIDRAGCTPGLRVLRLDLDEAALAASFADVAVLGAQCRFRDCRQVHEPGCAVRDQVPPDRLCGFLKLRREARFDELSELQRRQRVAQWKLRNCVQRLRAAAKWG